MSCSPELVLTVRGFQDHRHRPLGHPSASKIAGNSARVARRLGSKLIECSRKSSRRRASQIPPQGIVTPYFDRLARGRRRGRELPPLESAAARWRGCTRVFDIWWKAQRPSRQTGDFGCRRPSRDEENRPAHVARADIPGVSAIVACRSMIGALSCGALKQTCEPKNRIGPNDDAAIPLPIHPSQYSLTPNQTVG